jgi:putative flippase GtrA
MLSIMLVRSGSKRLPVITKIRQFLHRPTGRYLIIGGSVYLFELVVIFVAQYLGANALVAVGLSFWLGLIVSFVLQKIVTFGDRRLHHKVLVPQIIAFSTLVLFNFCFTLLITDILIGLLPAVVTRTLALGLTTIWNFYLYKTRIFKTDTNPIY